MKFCPITKSSCTAGQHPDLRQPHAKAAALQTRKVPGRWRVDTRICSSTRRFSESGDRGLVAQSASSSRTPSTKPATAGSSASTGDRGLLDGVAAGARRACSKGVQPAISDAHHETSRGHCRRPAQRPGAIIRQFFTVQRRRAAPAARQRDRPAQATLAISSRVLAFRGKRRPSPRRPDSSVMSVRLE